MLLTTVALKNRRARWNRSPLVCMPVWRLIDGVVCFWLLQCSALWTICDECRMSPHSAQLTPLAWRHLLHSEINMPNVLLKTPCTWTKCGSTWGIYVGLFCRKKNERKKREHKIFPMRNMAYLIIIILKMFCWKENYWCLLKLYTCKIYIHIHIYKILTVKLINYYVSIHASHVYFFPMYIVLIM